MDTFLEYQEIHFKYSSKNADEEKKNLVLNRSLRMLIVESSKNEGKSLSLKIFPPKLFAFFLQA